MFITLLSSFLVSCFAVFFALWIERKRLPSLEIIAKESANADVTYPQRHPHAEERWKFFRVAVKNKLMPSIFKWIPRQTAENCRARIEFIGLKNNKSLFSMNGRWSSTPEIPFYPGDMIRYKVLYPDPVTISASEEEFLDIIVMHEKDSVAYGWDNEAYLYNWRNPRTKLEEGKYKVKIKVNTSNGGSFSKEFSLIIGDEIDSTALQMWEK